MGKIARVEARRLAASDTYVDDERPLVQKIATFVEMQANSVTDMARSMLEVDADSLRALDCRVRKCYGL